MELAVQLQDRVRLGVPLGRAPLTFRPIEAHSGGLPLGVGFEAQCVCAVQQRGDQLTLGDRALTERSFLEIALDVGQDFRSNRPAPLILISAPGGAVPALRR